MYDHFRMQVGLKPKIIFVLPNPYDDEEFGKTQTSKLLLEIIAESKKDVLICNAIPKPGKIDITESIMRLYMPSLLYYIGVNDHDIIITFGRVAHYMLTRLNIKHENVSHPIYVFRKELNVDLYKKGIFRRMGI